MSSGVLFDMELDDETVDVHFLACSLDDMTTVPLALIYVIEDRTPNNHLRKLKNLKIG